MLWVDVANNPFYGVACPVCRMRLSFPSLYSTLTSQVPSFERVGPQSTMNLS